MISNTNSTLAFVVYGDGKIQTEASAQELIMSYLGVDSWEIAERQISRITYNTQIEDLGENTVAQTLTDITYESNVEVSFKRTT